MKSVLFWVFFSFKFYLIFPPNSTFSILIYWNFIFNCQFRDSGISEIMGVGLRCIKVDMSFITHHHRGWLPRRQTILPHSLKGRPNRRGMTLQERFCQDCWGWQTRGSKRQRREHPWKKHKQIHINIKISHEGNNKKNLTWFSSFTSSVSPPTLCRAPGCPASGEAPLRSE